MKGGFSMCMVNEIVLCMKLTSDEQIYSLKSVAEVRDTFSQQDVSGITGNSLKMNIMSLNIMGIQKCIRYVHLIQS